MDSKDLSRYQVNKYCRNMIEHVSHLSLRIDIYKALPPNVATVVAAGALIAHSNHAKSYILLYFRFSTATLLHLTSLTVRNMINVQDSYAVSLPSLRHLDCMMVTLRGSATFDTPALDKLELNSGSDMAAKMVIGGMPLYNDASAHGRESRDCLYVPMTRGSLIIERQWSAAQIIKFLEWSPYVERVSLSLGYEDDVRQILEYFLQRPHPVEETRLTELKLRGPFKMGDLKSMGGLAKKMIERYKKEFGLQMTIYGFEWKTGAGYVPLGQEQL